MGAEQISDSKSGAEWSSDLEAEWNLEQWKCEMGNMGASPDRMEQANSAMSFAQHPLLELVNLSSAPDLPEPLTHKEAMSRVDTPWWKEACEEEYQSLMDNNV